MKQLYTLALLVAATCTAMAQKPDTTKRYTITLQLADYQTLVQHMAQSKAWIPYAPSMPDKDKLEFIKGVDNYLHDLPNRVRLDSVKRTPK